MPLCSNCGSYVPGAVRESVFEPANGKLGDRFALEGRVTIGVLDEVFEARDLHCFDRKVVVRVLRPGFRSFEPIVQLFRQRAECAASIHHPNVPKVIDCGTTDEGLPFYAVSPCSTVSMESYLTASAGSPKQTRIGGPLLSSRFLMLKQIAGAIHEAHMRNFCHLTLHPRDIFVTETSSAITLEVSEFGVAKSLISRLAGWYYRGTQGNKYSTINEIYSAPEQCRGGWADMDLRVDIHALGVIALELFSNTLIRSEEQKNALLAGERRHRGWMLRREYPDAGLFSVFKRAMATDPHDRFDSIPDFMTTLYKSLGIPRSKVI